MEEQSQAYILVVTDEASNRDDLGKILQTEHRLEFIPSGAEVVNTVLERKPDLILLDLRLGGTDSFNLLQKLKELDETRDIPVILLTSNASVEDEERGLRLGAVDYLTRPFHNAIVTARIRIQLDLIKHIRTIERLGMIDALTDIPNRRFFDMRIKEEWRRTYRHKSCMSILMLDLDNFKKYNDTYGHPQGDRLLKFIGKVLMDNLHRPSDMAARLGGEEFAVLLGDTDTAGAVKVAEAIRRDIESGIVYTPEGEPTSITVSAGISSIVPAMNGDYMDLIQQADKYLYVAKENGRNRIAFKGQGPAA
ncbi:MAG: diguanylate cyclase [Treponema sp.]|jgi:diguanylate cyclase (GGDEF)-like protein|nr:diguanylate cyclase [Treponema sp.]